MPPTNKKSQGGHSKITTLVKGATIMITRTGDNFGLRPATLFTGQWTDLELAVLAEKAAGWGYQGLELACWGHFDVEQASGPNGMSYCAGIRELLAKYGLNVWAISNHLVGQCVCAPIDLRHKSILPERIWGDGTPEDVHKRAAAEMCNTAIAAKNLGVKVVNGFTGSPIWHLLYSFPTVPEEMIETGYREFADRWMPILDVFQAQEVKFALEVHPTEVAFDTKTAWKTLNAVDEHDAFGFNFDPSHMAYQGVDYIQFLYTFEHFIHHVHMKDVWWGHGDGTIGVFGGHTAFGDQSRYWDFRSLGRGDIRWEEVIAALNDIRYKGPLSVEWEDGRMSREFGACEARQFLAGLDFPPAEGAFDAAFATASKG